MSNLNPQEVLEFYSAYVSGVETYRDGTRAMAFCPFHDDTNNKSFSIDLGTGMFKCFSEACNAKGNVITFAQRNNIPVPAWAGGRDYRSDYLKTLTTNKAIVREYLLRRQIPKSYIDYLDQSSLFGCNLYDDNHWLVFPVFNKWGSIVAMNSVCVETGDKRTYGSYGQGYWIDGNFKFQGQVCFVEGIINSLTLNAFGIQSLSILTAGNNVDASAFEGMDVVLFLDNDPAGRSGARRLSRDLTGVANSVLCVDWGLDYPKGFDPNDVLMKTEGAREQFSDLINNARLVDEWSDYLNFIGLVNDIRSQ